MIEYLLSVDKFAKPKIIKGTKAVGVIMIRILNLIPGTNPLHPGMGVGLSQYRYITTDQLPDLQTIIEEQMSTYLPTNFQNIEVSLEIGEEKYLSISIVIDGISYIYETKESSTPIQLSDVVQR